MQRMLRFAMLIPAVVSGGLALGAAIGTAAHELLAHNPASPPSATEEQMCRSERGADHAICTEVAHLYIVNGRVSTRAFHTLIRMYEGMREIRGIHLERLRVWVRDEDKASIEHFDGLIESRVEHMLEELRTLTPEEQKDVLDLLLSRERFEYLRNLFHKPGKSI